MERRTFLKGCLGFAVLAVLPDLTACSTKTSPEKPVINTQPQQPHELSPEQQAAAAKAIFDEKRQQSDAEFKANNHFEKIENFNPANVDLKPQDVNKDILPKPDDLKALVPTLAISDELLTEIPKWVSYGNDSVIYNWVEIFHWVNHMKQADPSMSFIKDLPSYFNFLNNIVQDGLQGNGTIIYREASENAQEAYFFVSKVNGQQWATVVSGENGSLVTAFNSSLRGGASSDKEALRYVSKLLENGKIVSPEEVSDKVKELWNDDQALFRVVQESIKYCFNENFKQWLVTAGETAATAANFAKYMAQIAMNLPLVVLPTFLLNDCNINPKCEPVNG